MTTTTRSQFIANILQMREPLVKEIEHKQEILRRRKESFLKLKNLQEQIVQSGVQTLVDRVKDLPFGELQHKIDHVIQDLDKLKGRFARKTINIGVVGQARQGKSRLLGSLSGLDARAIPTGSSEHCTGVRSLICHIPNGEPYGEVSFYAESEFMSEVLAPYYKELQLGNPPGSLGEFQNNPLPPLSAAHPGPATPGEAYQHLEKYKKNINTYRTLVGAPSQRIKLEQVREYVAQDTVDAQRIYTKYLAVKEARVMCTFSDADVGQIALVDMPGLGDTVVGAEERLIRALGEHIDIVLFVYMPTSVKGMLDKADFNLYDLTYQALDGLPVSRWSFMVLNHTPTLSNKDDTRQYQNCQNIQQKTLTGGFSSQQQKSIKVVDAIIADCSNPEEARRRVLDRVLSYLVQNIRDLDKDYLLAWQKRLTLLQTEVDTVLDQAQRALSPTSSAYADNMLFEDLFRKLWRTLATALDDVRMDLTRESMKPNSTFEAYIQNRLKRCREDTGLPTTNEIVEIQHEFNSHDMAYRWLLNEMRTHLTQQFSDIDQELELSMNNLKQRLAKVFLQSGHLTEILAQVPTEQFFSCMAEHEGLDSHLRAVFLNFEQYKLSLRGFFLSKIRLENLNNATPDQTKLVPASQTVDAILNALKSAQQEAVDNIEKSLKREMHIPGTSALAAVEEFIDQVLYSSNAKDHWRAFYNTNRGKVWIPEFKESATREQYQREWQARIYEAVSLNQLDSLQFSYRP